MIGIKRFDCVVWCGWVSRLGFYCVTLTCFNSLIWERRTLVCRTRNTSNSTHLPADCRLKVGTDEEEVSTRCFEEDFKQRGLGGRKSAGWCNNSFLKIVPLEAFNFYIAMCIFSLNTEHSYLYIIHCRKFNHILQLVFLLNYWLKDKIYPSVFPHKHRALDALSVRILKTLEAWKNETATIFFINDSCYLL